MTKANARKIKAWQKKQHPGKLERHVVKLARRWREKVERGEIITGPITDYARYHD